MNKNKLFFLFTISVLLFSCKIEKRQYMSGYHIEWKNAKHEVVQENSAETSKNEIKKESSVVQEIKSAVANPEQTEPVHQTPTIIESSINSNELVESDMVREKSNDAVVMQESDMINDTETTVSETNSTGLKQVDGVKDGGVGKGILFLICALLLFGLGLLFYFMLGVFGLILMIIFGIAAAIYLIVGLIMVIAG